MLIQKRMSIRGKKWKIDMISPSLCASLSHLCLELKLEPPPTEPSYCSILQYHIFLLSLFVIGFFLSHYFLCLLLLTGLLLVQHYPLNIHYIYSTSSCLNVSMLYTNWLTQCCKCRFSMLESKSKATNICKILFCNAFLKNKIKNNWSFRKHTDNIPHAKIGVALGGGV